MCLTLQCGMFISEIEDLPNSVRKQLFDELLDANAQKGCKMHICCIVIYKHCVIHLWCHIGKVNG